METPWEKALGWRGTEARGVAGVGSGEAVGQRFLRVP